MTLEVLLKHTFPNFTADVEFTAPTPGVVALFGPSGCGKSTVMSAVAGLLKADEVRVALDGVVLSDLHPADRGIGVVFQDGRLFPHMTVASNLRYGMRRAEAGPVDFDQTVELLGIAHLLNRRPKKLSGGERQRVAIGRALLRQPRLLLMDEPLSALDAARKGEILPFLQRLHDEMHIPILLVTHSIEEVARLADTLVLMEKGKVAANGPVGEVLARADLPFATGSQAGAVIASTVAAHDAARGLTRLDAGGVTIWVPLLEAAPGTRLRVRVPANEVALATDAPLHISSNNIIPGRVRAVRATPDGKMAMAEVTAGDALFLSQLTPDAVQQLAIAPERPVLAVFKSIGVQVL
ncbi:molybdenum ABC transporter ATP-binding protein [Xanthobacter sp. V3C-3]|uniref:molybdenum ABC transporter ATP-binding protein n=1 Tax=Xanthobacter lutulentifluminis TaxID=3119935 RepID=UPI003729EBE8